MKLKEVIKQVEDSLQNMPYSKINIAYRQYVPEIVEKDVFIGACDYENGELISLDGDNYSLEDEISDWNVSYYNSREGVLEVVVYLNGDYYERN